MSAKTEPTNTAPAKTELANRTRDDRTNRAGPRPVVRSVIHHPAPPRQTPAGARRPAARPHQAPVRRGQARGQAQSPDAQLHPHQLSLRRPVRRPPHDRRHLPARPQRPRRRRSPPRRAGGLPHPRPLRLPPAPNLRFPPAPRPRNLGRHRPPQAAPPELHRAWVWPSNTYQPKLYPIAEDGTIRIYAPPPTGDEPDAETDTVGA